MPRPSRRRRALAGTAVVGTLLLAPAVQALEWELVEPQHATSADHAPAASPIHTDRLAWELVIPGDEISPGLVAQEVEDAEALREQAIASVPEPTPWITGGLYQISRGEEGLPAISQRLPSGYGSRFLGLQLGLFLESCKVEGSNVCGSDSFVQQFKDRGGGAVDFNLGLGDPTRWLGIDLGYNFTSLATTRPGQDTAGTPFGTGQGLNLALSRNLGPDWSVKVGAINLIELDETQKDWGRSAYALLSGRIDLGGPPNSNTNDLYLTAGLANGLFRPLDTIVKDQGRACDALRRRKDTDVLTPQQIRNCNADGLNYGSPNPVASVAWMINPQLSLIAEWWGRNLTLAASIKPIPGVNWVITPGVTNLVKNSDWDPDVPGYTERVRLQLTTSLAF